MEGEKQEKVKQILETRAPNVAKAASSCFFFLFYSKMFTRKLSIESLGGHAPITIGIIIDIL